MNVSQYKGMALLAMVAVWAAVAPAARAAQDAALATSGKYELLGQAPIAAAHQLQLPCGSNQFLLMGE